MNNVFRLYTGEEPIRFTAFGSRGRMASQRGFSGCEFDGANRPSGRGSGQPLRLASEPRGALSDPMPPARTIVKYAIDALLIFAPLCGVMYFLFDPDAFNAFLAWLARVL